MCNRFTLIFDPEFFRRFMIQSQKSEISPRYSIAPMQEVTITINEEGNKAVMMRFGLIPSWLKKKKIRYILINARAETVTLQRLADNSS